MVVGFRNISISKCGVFLMITRSRKLIQLFCSGVGQIWRLCFMVLADDRTPADQINARFVVRVKNMAVDEPVITTLSSLMTHIWQLLLTV